MPSGPIFSTGSGRRLAWKPFCRKRGRFSIRLPISKLRRLLIGVSVLRARPCLGYGLTAGPLESRRNGHHADGYDRGAKQAGGPFRDPAVGSVAPAGAARGPSSRESLLPRRCGLSGSITNRVSSIGRMETLAVSGVSDEPKRDEGEEGVPFVKRAPRSGRRIVRRRGLAVAEGPDQRERRCLGPGQGCPAAPADV